MLNDYVDEKNSIKAKVQACKSGEVYSLSLEDIFDCAETLYDLKHTGEVFRELHDVQLKCLNANKGNG